jgi:hypothetical protein
LLIQLIKQYDDGRDPNAAWAKKLKGKISRMASGTSLYRAGTCANNCGGKRRGGGGGDVLPKVHF